MELHKKYRPKSLSEIVGNTIMVQTIESILERDRKDIPHSWLFMGQKGSGKTTTGRIVASHLLGMPADKKCPDFIQIDGGDVKADVVKEIKKQIPYKPAVAKCRVFLIEEAHMVGAGGASEKNIPQNNLLTTLEEPPPHIYFILCTTDPQRLIKTIHDRCHTFSVSPLSDKEMKTLIDRVLKEEGVDEFPESAIEAIISVADGTPRTALKILDQVLDLEDDAIVSAINSYVTLEAEVIDLCRSVVNKESWPRTLEILSRLKDSGQDAENVRRAIMGYISKIALSPKKVRRGDEDPMIRLTDIYEVLKYPTYNNGWADIIFSLFQLTI
ncbi:MAG: AAA family ATPase [Bacteriovoracaceae bacterium]